MAVAHHSLRPIQPHVKLAVVVAVFSSLTLCGLTSLDNTMFSNALYICAHAFGPGSLLVIGLRHFKFASMWTLAVASTRWISVAYIFLFANEDYLLASLDSFNKSFIFAGYSCPLHVWGVRFVCFVLGVMQCVLPCSQQFRYVTVACLILSDLASSGIITIFYMGDASLIFIAIHVRLVPFVFGVLCVALAPSFPTTKTVRPSPARHNQYMKLENIKVDNLVLWRSELAAVAGRQQRDRAWSDTVLHSQHEARMAVTIPFLGESSPSEDDSSDGWGPSASPSRSSEGDDALLMAVDNTA